MKCSMLANLLAYDFSHPRTALQLPPTIMSRFAANMGLSTSLHERLMNQCSAEYVMLDCQYRMHTQISQFPCSQFYNSRITDGKNVSW